MFLLAYRTAADALGYRIDIMIINGDLDSKWRMGTPAVISEAYYKYCVSYTHYYYCNTNYCICHTQSSKLMHRPDTLRILGMQQ